MRIITKKRLFDFAKRYPDTKTSLINWHRIMKNTNYSSLAEIRKTFPSADCVGNMTVFNIGGNKVRLIAAIHYNRKIIYIRHVLTHAKYDKGKWKE